MNGLIASEQALALHRRSLVWDCLALRYVLDAPYTDRLIAGGVGVAAVSVVIEEDWETSLRLIDQSLEKIERSGTMRLVLNDADIDRARQEGKIGIVFATQGATLIGKELWRVKLLERLGIRFLGLCYSPANLYGDGCGESRDAGLTYLGRDLIAAVNETCMILDLSHSGHRTTAEAIELARAPVCTHANPYAVQRNDRNKKDETIRRLLDKGGMMGACALPKTVKNLNQTIDDYVDHIDYMRKTFGPKSFGLGMDYIEAYAENRNILPESKRWRTLRPDVWGTVEEFYTERYPEGLSSIAQLPNLTQKLLDRGFDETEIQGVLGGNWRRVFASFCG